MNLEKEGQIMKKRNVRMLLVVSVLAMSVLLSEACMPAPLPTAAPI